MAVKKKRSLKRDDHSTTVKQQSQNVRWMDYACIYTGSMKPMNEVGIERLANEVVVWAHTTKTALKISEFWWEKGINRETWRRWCHQFPKLKSAHDTAKEILGDRREIGAITKLYNAGTIHWTMSHYDPEWLEIDKRQSSLKINKDDGDDKVKFIIMEKAASSDLVPERIKIENR